MRPSSLLAPPLACVVALSAAGCYSAEEPVGQGPDRAPAPVVWVAAEGADAFTLVDAGTGEVLTTVHGVAAPHNVQASSDGEGVWATSTGGVVRLDAGTLTVDGTNFSGGHPAHVVETLDGSVWVSAYEDGVVYEHAADFSESVAHPLGGGPHGMRIAGNGRFAAIANTDAGTLDLLDLEAVAGQGDDGLHTHGADGHAALNPVRSVRVGPAPIQAAVTADSSTVFVSVSGRSQVARVDVATGRVTGRVQVPSGPAQVWVTASGLLLSANQGTEQDPGRTLSIIDAGTLEVLAEVETGSGPHGVVVDSQERFAWVTNMFDDTLTTVDLESWEVVRTVEVGDRPNGITITPAGLTGNVGGQVHVTVPAAFAPGAGSEHEHGSTRAGGDADEHRSDEGHRGGRDNGADTGGHDAGGSHQH